jgi:hypothetical protein
VGCIAEGIEIAKTLKFWYLLKGLEMWFLFLVFRWVIISMEYVVYRL